MGHFEKGRYIERDNYHQEVDSFGVCRIWSDKTTPTKDIIDCYTYSIDRSDLYKHTESLNTFYGMLYRLEKLESKINGV